MATQRTLKLNLLADVDKFGKGLGKAGRETQTFGDKVKKFGKVAAAAFAAAGAAAATMAVKFGLEGVKAASDLNEEIGKAEVIFGDVSDEIMAFAKTADRALGLTQKEAINAASTFATFGKAAGLSGKDLSKFSKGATTLASDLASFYNTNADEAITAIGAALRGESEPIRRFGVLLNDASLKAKAMEMGLYDGKGALDVQAKSLAAYEVILDQTTDAQGDFARTSDGLAGQQKILDAQLENLKTTMGQSLLPVMKDLVTQANFMAAAFGGKDPEGLSQRARELAGVYDGQGSGAYNLGLALRNVADAFTKMFDAMSSPDGDQAATTLQKVANAINNIATGMEKLSVIYDKIKPFLKILPSNLLSRFLTNALVSEGKSLGGSVRANQAVRVGEMGKEVFIPSTGGQIIPHNKLGGGGNTFIFNGVIDGESARRSIERVLQNSTLRTGQVNLAGSPL